MVAFIYILLPSLLLALCARFKPSVAWLLIPLCPVLDILFFRPEFGYYEARAFLVLFTCIQVSAVTLAAIPVALFRERPRFRSRLFGSLTVLTATLMVLIVGAKYQHHVYFSYSSDAFAIVNLLYAIPFIPFILLFFVLTLRFRRTEVH